MEIKIVLQAHYGALARVALKNTLIKFVILIDLIALIRIISSFYKRPRCFLRSSFPRHMIFFG